ncbi:hypothetical protein ACYCFC_15790 [Stutzerimonas sp. NM35]
MKKILTTIAAVTLLTGCTTFETVSRQSPEAEEILTFNAPLDGAALYLYRDRKSSYGGVEMILDINDKEVSLAGSCLKRVELTPGTYHLNANHPDLLGGEQELDITLSLGDVKILEFKPILRPIIPGESKLIPRTIEELRSLVDSQPLCILATTKL